MEERRDRFHFPVDGRRFEGNVTVGSGGFACQSRGIFGSVEAERRCQGHPLGLEMSAPAQEGLSDRDGEFIGSPFRLLYQRAKSGSKGCRAGTLVGGFEGSAALDEQVDHGKIAAPNRSVEGRLARGPRW